MMTAAVENRDLITVFYEDEVDIFDQGISRLKFFEFRVYGNLCFTHDEVAGLKLFNFWRVGGWFFSMSQFPIERKTDNGAQYDYYSENGQLF